MACFVPYNSRNLDVSFLVLKPTVVFVDELVEALRHFSLWTETLGCIHSSILQSIHGNMVILIRSLSLSRSPPPCGFSFLIKFFDFIIFRFYGMEHG